MQLSPVLPENLGCSKVESLRSKDLEVEISRKQSWVVYTSRDLDEEYDYEMLLQVS